MPIPLPSGIWESPDGPFVSRDRPVDRCRRCGGSGLLEGEACSCQQRECVGCKGSGIRSTSFTKEHPKCWECNGFGYQVYADLPIKYLGMNGGLA